MLPVYLLQIIARFLSSKIVATWKVRIQIGHTLHKWHLVHVNPAEICLVSGPVALCLVHTIRCSDEKRQTEFFHWILRPCVGPI